MEKKFICNVCGYVHEGKQPPGRCPKCGVGPERFSASDEIDAYYG